MNYSKAVALANMVREDIYAACERIEVAGSVRRQKQDGIKDIELICIPRLHEFKNLLGETSTVNLVEYIFPQFVQRWGATILKNGKKYKQIALLGTSLDLFIVTADTWGVQFAIRTGPAEYSKWLVTKRCRGGALPDDCSVSGGLVWRGGNIIPTPEERDVFVVCGIATPLPSARCVSNER